MDQLLGELLLALGRRVSRVAQKSVQGHNRVTGEEIVEQVGEKVLATLLGTTPTRASEFLEVSFGAAVGRWTVDAVRYRRARVPLRAAVAESTTRDTNVERDKNQHLEWDGRGDPHAEPFTVTRDRVGLDGSFHADPEAVAADLEAFERCPDPLRRGLDAIRDPRHREALVLHHLEGWPIVHKDPNTQTLCKRFGSSERQIRTWIATAMAEMREAIGDKS
jgi:DNA-directed RNA polymerase specialized sigma24 family protein